jgi:glycosyl transferase family 87
VATRSASWSRPAELGPAVLVTAAALFLFSVSWLALQHGFYRHKQIRDTPVYQRYGDAIVGGKVPYRDVRIEYPPGALPAFVLPSAVRGGGERFDEFRRLFEALMVVCGAAGLLFTGLAARSLGREPPQLAAALFFAALAPLALGSVILSRFDLWPAAISAGALAALLAGRRRLGFGALGLGIATKVYPVVLLPLFVAFVWRREGRREALRCGALLTGVVAACVLPFVALSPGGVWSSVVRQLDRPLQIESLASGILLAAHHAFGLAVTVDSSHGSQNLAGTLPDALAAGQTVLQAGVLLAVWTAFARGPAGPEPFVRASAAAVTAFVALAKVVSPQFLIWLLFLVPLVRGRRGLAAGGLLAAALVLTQLWFPYRYWDLVFDLDAPASWLVLARDAVLLALTAVLAWPERRISGSEPQSQNGLAPSGTAT